LVDEMASEHNDMAPTSKMDSWHFELATLIKTIQTFNEQNTESKKSL